MKNAKIKSLFLFLLIFSFTLNIIKVDILDSSNKMEIQEGIHLSAEIPGQNQWLENPNFTVQEPWYSSKEGDTSDVNASISGGHANYEILGTSGRKEISNPINIANKDNWQPFNKSEPAINPDDFYIDDDGFFVTHSWHDATADQFASIYLRYNVSMNIDMLEYNITSASLEAIMNATVDDNIDTPTDTTTETNDGERTINQPGIYDHAFFYVEIADMDLNSIYRVAYNQTNDLGRNSPPLLTYDDKPIEAYGDEKDLIYSLKRVFEKDPGHDNFYIIIGIEISCEDDYTGQDYDDWTELRIKSLNLTFTYDKLINQFTSVSWNQIADKISDISNYTVVVTDAKLNFKYKIDQNWPTILSPNSEIRVLINDNKHTETVKLSIATTSFQEAKLGGFDVSNLITDDLNLSLQVFIADEFGLSQVIVISIDDVSLYISYIIIEPDVPGPDWGWLIYVLTGAMIGLVVVFTLYQTHFKYPPMVRKIRKLKKNVRKAKKTKPIVVNKREEIIKNSIQNQINVLEIEAIQPEKIDIIDKIPLDKEGT